jgi:predicted transcriptional regulator
MTAAPALHRGRRFSGGLACVTLCRPVAQEEAVPDDQPLTSHVSLRMPNDLIEAFDRIATALERPRSWIMVRALRQYLDEGEGREIEEDTESLAELDRGESAPLEDSIRKLRERIAEKERSGGK